mgnify:CR=1 FL=1
MVINIPYGKTYQKLECEEQAMILESELSKMQSQEEKAEIVKKAMANPIGSEPLKVLASDKKTAVLIVSDHTRPVPSKYIVPQMLKELREGNPNIDITILVATGCHRGTKKEELISKLGAEIVESEKIEVHDCDKSPVTDMGVLPSGAHLILNSIAANADLVISEGFIEPHFFAGYSGGRKSILPGICGRKTVLGNHCSAFIKNPMARMGILEGNPINRDMEAAAKMAKLAYIVNVIIDEEKKVVAAFAGDCIAAHHAGCKYLESFCSIVPEKKGDIVITSNGGAPLDQNVYQAVKGLTTAEAAASPHGTLIICAECADGIGGDQFYRALSQSENAETLLQQIEKVPMEETVPDQWQYQILARILKQHRVIFVTNSDLKEKIIAMKMAYANSLQEAYERAKETQENGVSLLVIPNGVSIVVKEAE